jgi:DNA polymerase-1
MDKKWSVDKRQGYEGAFGYDLDRNSSDYGYNLFARLRESEDPAVHKDADDLRKDAKGVNFAAQFDAQAKKLSEMLTIPLNEAQSFLDAKYAMFPGVETWKDEVRQRLMSNGYVTTLMGARRHLAASVTHPDKWIAERAGRQGPNFMIQGSAAEMTKLALARLWKSGVFIDPEVRFYFPVHDEIVWSASSGRMLEVTRVVNECMAQPYSTLQVPILGSISVGRTFGKQVEAGDWFVAEKVEKAMAKALAG